MLYYEIFELVLNPISIGAIIGVLSLLVYYCCCGQTQQHENQLISRVGLIDEKLYEIEKLRQKARDAPHNNDQHNLYNQKAADCGQSQQHESQLVCLVADQDKEEIENLRQTARQASDSSEHDLYNQRAAEMTYNRYNSGRTLNKLDLHQLYKGEAVEAVEDRLQELRTTYKGNFNSLLVITGRGIHSDGQPVLNKAIREYLKDTGNRIQEDFSNDGSLRVIL